MREVTRNRRFSRLAGLAAGALGLLAVALPLHQAKADTMYLGWDFGSGFGRPLIASSSNPGGSTDESHFNSQR